MCNRARLRTEPETLKTRFKALWSTAIPNHFPIELTPRSRAPVIRSAETQRIIDLMSWDVLGGHHGRTRCRTTHRCHDAKGKFIKCPPATSAPVPAAMAQSGITKDKNGKCHVASGPAKGRFAACPK